MQNTIRYKVCFQNSNEITTRKQEVTSDWTMLLFIQITLQNLTIAIG